jgi:hypothetical protein
MMSLKVRLPATWLRGDFDPRFSLALARKDLGLARPNVARERIPDYCHFTMVSAFGATGQHRREANTVGEQ